MTSAKAATSQRADGRRFTWLVATLLAIGISVAYWNSFGIGFYFDDDGGIAQNPAIRSFRNVPNFFVDPLSYSTEGDARDTDLRPVLFVTYAANYAISGVDPWSYHALNLLLHFIGSLLVFVIVRDYLWWPASARGPDGEARLAAAAAALFFALAPLNTQPVNYLWARSALLCVTLYLGALLAYLRGRWALGSGLFALSLLTKAIAVTLPAVLLIHDVVYRDRERYPSLRLWLQNWRRFAPAVALTVVLDAVYLVYRTIVSPLWGGVSQLHIATPGVWFMTAWAGLLYYVHLFLWPDALSVDHGFPLTTSLLQPRAWGSLLVLLAWLVLALKAWKRYPQVTFATFWFFIVLAPESSIFPLAQTVNDHRPYIASALGLSVLLAWALWQGAVLLAPRAINSAFITGCLLLLVPAVAVDRHRTWVWGDPLRMWEDTVRTSPDSAIAPVNLAMKLMQRGDLEKARPYIERGIEQGPDIRGIALAMLAMVETQEGHLDQALHDAQEAVRAEPDNFKTHTALASVLGKMGRTTEADATLRIGLERDPPRNPELLAQLNGILQAHDAAAEQEKTMSVGLDALYKSGDLNAAADAFRKVLTLNPNHLGAMYQLAKTLDLAGHPADARAMWEKTLERAEALKDGVTAASARTRLVGPGGAHE